MIHIFPSFKETTGIYMVFKLLLDKHQLTQGSQPWSSLGGLRWPLLGVNTLQHPFFLIFFKLIHSWGRYLKLCNVLFNLLGFCPFIDGHWWSLWYSCYGDGVRLVGVSVSLCHVHWLEFYRESVFFLIHLLKYFSFKAERGGTCL